MAAAAMRNKMMTRSSVLVFCELSPVAAGAAWVFVVAMANVSRPRAL